MPYISLVSGVTRVEAIVPKTTREGGDVYQVVDGYNGERLIWVSDETRVFVGRFFFSSGKIAVFQLDITTDTV